MAKKSGKKSLLFSNSQLLDETPKIDTLVVGQDKEINLVSDRIDKYVEAGSSRIVAYLGDYGAGKSLVLYNVEKNNRKEYKYVNFDIWQYSDASKIWDAFAIEAISSIEGSDKDKIVHELDGKGFTTKVKILIFCALLVVYVIASYMLWEFLKGDQFARDFFVYAAPMFLAIAAIFGINSLMPVKSRISRTYQYEKRLRSAIESSSQPVVIVVEDVDRSDNGQTFLESLHIFFEQKELNNPVVVICPQRSLSFGSMDKPLVGKDQSTYHNELEKSIKIYDSVINSSLSGRVSSEQVSGLLDSLGCNDDKFRKLLLRLILLAGRESLLTIRALKFILREVYDMQYENPNIDTRVALLCVASRYITYKPHTVSSDESPVKKVFHTLQTSGVNLMNKIEGDKVEICKIILEAVGESFITREKTNRKNVKVVFTDLGGREFNVLRSEDKDSYGHTTYELYIEFDLKYEKLVY